MLHRLVEAGGGNVSNLLCNGVKNAGAAQVANLTATLMKCEDDIHTACHPNNLPQPNATEMMICNTAITSFSTGIEACQKLTDGVAACGCFGNVTLMQDAAIIKTCDRKYILILILIY